MLSFHNIWTVAKFEIKTLSRSWFLRIFAVLSVVLLFLFDLIMFTDVTGGFIPRFFYGMSASVPYANLMLFNLAQAIITIFLASDFLKRDKKLDTTEVIYIRSITNRDYVLGKAIGIVLIFLALNVIVLLLAAIFNIVNPETSFNFLVYLYYLLLSSIPTLIYMIGLTFLIMTLIPNQAVTFILLLGYVAVTLFYLGWDYYQIFDYTAFFIPMMHSDFMGFGNLDALILQRAGYFLLGFGMIFITMYKFRRLPQANDFRKVSLVLAALLVIAGSFSIFLYASGKISGRSLRNEMIGLNTGHLNEPEVSIEKNKLTVNHEGTDINCTSELTITNSNDSPLKSFLLNLNPGLTVTAIEANGSNVDFERNLHLITIKLQNPLNSRDTMQLKLSYAGKIDDNASYLDISEDVRNRMLKVFYTVDKKYSVVSPEYVLLTAENMWYPRAGVTYSPDAQFDDHFNFTKFELTVNTAPGLTVISQGAVSGISDNGSGSFKPDMPLPQISLTIGEYVSKNIEVDSVNYSLYTYDGHNYYETYLNEIDDTLSALVRELKQDYERELGLEYPFRSLSLVEVPIQFNCYPRIWTSAQEKVQPQLVFLPENGLYIDEADFKQRQKMQERFGNRGNQVITPVENQSNFFKRFVRSTFLSESSRFRFGGPNTNLNDGRPYELFPNYFTYVNNVSSSSLPVFNRILADYLNISSGNNNPFTRAYVGLTDDEKAAQILYDKSLEEIISDTTNNRYLPEIIKLKGDYLFTNLENRLGNVNLDQLIRRILSENKFTKKGFTTFKETLTRNYNVNFDTLVSEWFKSSKLPAYLITNVQGYKIVDDDRERYQVSFDLTNTEAVDGFIRATFEPRRGGPGRFGPMSGGGEETSLAEKLIQVDAKQSVKVSTVLDESPGRLSISTIISKNLPLEQEINFDKFDENKNIESFDGTIVLDELKSFVSPGDIIVDNEDPGFEIFNPEQTSFLKRFFNLGQDDEKYIGLRVWGAPDIWKAAVTSEAYGEFIHSVHFTKAGDGNTKVAWNNDFDESGNYDVYVYIPKPRIPGRRRAGNNDNQEYHYTVFSDDGEEEVSLNYGDSDEGWNQLGSFYISTGTSKVELSNKSGGGLVLADAVKWVKRR